MIKKCKILYNRLKQNEINKMNRNAKKNVK